MAEILDITTIRDPFSIPEIADTPCFKEYKSDPEENLDVRNVARYVILLYAKDSPLSKRPIKPLLERRVIAAKMADLDPQDEQVINLVFNLLSAKVRDLILGYLIYQNQLLWAERCILEAQIEENQRVRMKPIQNKTISSRGRKKKKNEDESNDGEDENREEDDRYILDASNKKSSLTDHFQKYFELLRKVDLEIFSDHDEVKKTISKKQRVTLESLAS